jgi:hypothetical protein
VVVPAFEPPTGDNVRMEVERSRGHSDEVVYRYQPEGSFTRTMGWLFALLPLIGVLAGLIDLFSGRSATVGLVTIGLSLGLAGLLYLGSRAVDRAQERIRVEVLPQGVLRFRNLVGREREIPLRDAQSFEVKDLRGKPRLVSTMGGARRRNPFSGDVELRGRSGNRRSPHLTEIRVKDERGKRHVIRLSGAMPVKEVRRLNEAINSVREV